MGTGDRPVASSSRDQRLKGPRVAGAVNKFSDAMPAARTDGRRLRSVRTRQLIIEAYLLLLRESPQIPQPRRSRSVPATRFDRCSSAFPIFIRCAWRPPITRCRRLPCGSPSSHLVGDRAARLRIHVEMRGRVCEEWLPLWRALNANQGESDELKGRIRQVRELIIRRLEAMYEPELSNLGSVERRRDGPGDRGADRLRKLGTYAGNVWPVLRGGMRHLGEGNRPFVACDAAGFLTLRSLQRRKAPLRWERSTMAAVAQLVRAPDCDSGCRRFNSGRPPQSPTCHGS